MRDINHVLRTTTFYGVLKIKMRYIQPIMMAIKLAGFFRGMKNQILVCGLLITISAQSSYAQILTDTIFDRGANDSFAYGADISWLPVLESLGYVWRDNAGNQKDLLDILKEKGVNAVRFRVWVNPDNGENGKDFVVDLAKRAHAKGFRIMINFHYSDSWADPGKQYKPAEWEDYSFPQLLDAVYDHTYDVLDALKQNGITPEWVQVGNETRRGMLWPEGHTDNGFGNFTQLINKGYDAVKAIDSSIKVINHVDNGHDNDMYRWMYDGLTSNGAKFDIIGMSAYPRWSKLDGPTLISRVISNLDDMKSRYNKEVMVVESGHYWHEPYMANNYLVELMKALIDEGGTGNFYWEPQYYGNWYEMGAWNPETQQPTLAMDAFLGIKHTDPATLMQITLDEPAAGETFTKDQNIPITANASHSTGTITKVTFYVNDEPVAALTEEPYSFELPNPGIGNYSIYASATDDNGYVVESEKITIEVGVVSIFQENADGYCGITDNAGTIDANHGDYTGEGFINADNESGITVTWTVKFIEAGKYSIQFRYAGTATRPGKVTISGESIDTVSFPSTGAWDSWDFSSVNYTATEAGVVPISLTATVAEGLPNIDYMSIRSLDGEAKTEASTYCLDQSDIPTLIIENEASNNLKIYPTPTRNVLRVESSSENLDSINIYGLDGALVKAIPDVNSQIRDISCTDLTTGMYIMQIKVGNKTYSRKFHIVK